jgi:serine/threonine protein kinase
MSETPAPVDPADDLRLRGNFEFSAGRYDEALALYNSALEVASPSSKVILLCNRSATYLQQEEYELAEQDAADAWKLSQETSVKAAFRLAKTQLALRKFEGAKDTIQAALKVLDSQEKREESEEKGVAKTEAQNEVKEKTGGKKPAPQSQRKALEDIWKQVLAEALEHDESDKKPETSVKYVKRPVSIREFKKCNTLGHGNFSEIVVVQHKTTKEDFALKMITKKQAADLAKRQHPNVYNEIQMERAILLERLPPHRNIVRMYHAFQDYNTLYYLMDLHIVSTDLWSELQWKVTEDEGLGKTFEKKYMTGCNRSQAVRWTYQLVDALEHMHRHGVVHRDLKTENILLNERGHIVVIDFGTAKDLILPALNGPEFVGTPDFMSPEAVNGTSGMLEGKEAADKGEIGAVHTADLWALGAVLYIMQTGMTPFWSPSPYLGFLKIKRGILTRPVGVVDDEAWDLIQSLMKMEPSERLGANAFELVFENEKKKTGKRHIESKPGGYDVIRNHPYFDSVRDIEKNPEEKETYVLPSLQDLCVRAVVTAAHRESLDFELCDRHPPGDGSRHDLTRLSPRDHAAVMHVLDRRRLLRDPRLYARFYKDSIASRLDKIRPATRDFVGLTQMNDEQSKPPALEDPYGTPIPMDDITIVHLTNPLLVKEKNESCDEETRKKWFKLFKKCIANINRSRPRLVVVCGHVDEKCRKLLARINESIPVVVHNGSVFFTFWMVGVQCIAVKSSELAEDSEQVVWLRSQMEQSRMTKHPLFCFADEDPRDLALPVLKRLARGRALGLYGPSKDETFATKVAYEANETIEVEGADDDLSIRSIDSEEDPDKDSFTMKMEGTSENGLRWITIDEKPDVWEAEFKAIRD